MIIGGLAFAYRVPAQATAIRVYSAMTGRLRRAKRFRRH
jgi:hypothetical protein